MAEAETGGSQVKTAVTGGLIRLMQGMDHDKDGNLSANEIPPLLKKSPWMKEIDKDETAPSPAVNWPPQQNLPSTNKLLTPSLPNRPHRHMLSPAMRRISAFLLPLLLSFSVPQSRAETLNFAPLDGSTFDFNDGGTLDIKVTGAPAEADWNRIGMASSTSDGTYSLFMMKKDSGSQLYIFQFDNGSFIYRPTRITIANRPTDLDSGSFAVTANSTKIYFMAHNRGTPNTIYLAPGGTATDGSYVFDFDAPDADTFSLKNVPSDLDWSSWSAGTDVNGGTQLFVGKQGTKRRVYRAKLDAFSRDDFEFDDDTFKVEGAPFGSSTTDFMNAIDSRGVHVLITKSQSIPDAFPDAVALDDAPGWYWTEWFGFFNGDSYPWIYRDGAGWYWVAGDNGPVYIFSDATNQWLWTSPDVFPAAVDLTTGVWGDLD